MSDIQRENCANGYLARLNAEQRRAVEHGGGALHEAPPLLIIAGAGSGKTNTLAHRVAHLSVSGADPRRIMLLTFSRRAANEMRRRIERIARQVMSASVMGPGAGLTTDGLSWSGTFHAIGARLIREYALDIGLDRAFTIHDREDSADLMNLARHELGLSTKEKRFPMKGTCLAIYSRAVTVADDVAQAGYVVAKVLESREAGVALKKQAVLFRASHHSATLEIELTRRNIPFMKFGGLKFLEARHIKDVLALLRFAQNMRDRVAGFRVAQLLPGVGPAAAGRLIDSIEQTGDAAGAAEHWPDLEQTIGALRRNALGWPGELDAALRWYEPHLERLHDDAAIRQADLTQLAQIAASYPSRERFLTELTLDPPDATSDEAGTPLLDEDYLVLSTIHSAKGQEWTSVFVLNTVDGFIPSRLTKHFESRVWPAVKPAAPAHAAADIAVDLRAKLKRMWA